MRTEYGRNSQSSFVRIPLEGELQKTEEEMLGRNQIEGLLAVIWQKEDESYMLRYDITGKQALDMVLEGTTADERLLVNLIQEICSLCKRLEKFLLSQDGVLLDAELIYWDGKSEKFYFCYYPGKRGVFQSEFVHLVEYLLTKTDHKNVRAVEMVYGVYEALMQPDYNIQEIQNCLETIRKTWKDQEEIKDIWVVSDNVESMDEKTNRKERLENRSIVVIIREWLEEKMNAWLKPEWKNGIKSKKQVAEFVFEPEPEPEKPTFPTVLLSTESQEVEGILKYEGRMALPDLYITKVPFWIGSEEQCDGVISDVTVSRKHAVITKVDDTYFIEDLNSSNGTKIAGEYISYKTRVSLKKNDSVLFSNQLYRFM